MLLDLGRGLAPLQNAFGRVLQTYDFSGAVLPAGATLARASVGSYFDSAGVLRTAGVDAARFDHAFNGAAWSLAGLLVEGARTNLNLHSGAMATGPAWFIQEGGTLAANQGTVPDGTNSATKISEQTLTQQFYDRQNHNVTITLPHVFSCFLKKGTRRWAAVGNNFASGSGGQRVAFFDLETGALGVVDDNATGTVSAEIVDVGGGWFRCVATIAALPAATHRADIGIADADGNRSDRLGDAAENILAWGYQIEQAATPSSYIATTTAAATRSADTLNLDLADGQWLLEVETPGATYTGVASAGAGYDFDWADFPGAVAAGARHINKITVRGLSAAIAWAMAGAVTADGFTVTAEVAGAATLELAVSAEPDMAPIVAASAPVATTTTDFDTAGGKETVKLAIAGLAPDTLHHWSVKPNAGLFDPAFTGRIRTAPAVLAAKSFAFAVHGDINLGAATGDLDALTVIANEGAAFAIMTGDRGYANVTSLAQGAMNKSFREATAKAEFRTLLAALPEYWTWNDHDSFGGNNSHWATANFRPGMANARAMRASLYPDPPYLAAGAGATIAPVGQAWTWGRCCFVMPDMQSQRYEGSPPGTGSTMLGDGRAQDGETMSDQVQAVKDRMTAYAAACYQVCFFVSSAITNNAGTGTGEGWMDHWSAEWDELNVFFRDLDMQVFVICGDRHLGFIDDGRGAALSTSFRARDDCAYPTFQATPINSSVRDTTGFVASWNGVDTEVGLTAPNYGIIEVTDNGSDITIVSRIKGNPLTKTGDPATWTATEKKSATTADASPTNRKMDFTSATYTAPVPTGTAIVTVEKSWFGPIGANASVDYATADGTASAGTHYTATSATLTFKPNERRKDIAVPIIADMTGLNFAITLSTPANAALGTTTSATVSA